MFEKTKCYFEVNNKYDEWVPKGNKHQTPKTAMTFNI